MVTNDGAHLQSHLLGGLNFGGLKQNFEFKTSLDNTMRPHLQKQDRQDKLLVLRGVVSDTNHWLWELKISNTEAKRSETRLIFYESEDAPQNIGLLTYMVTCRT